MDKTPSDLHGSVTRVLVGLKVGDPVAAQKLWENYYQRLVSLARKKLEGRPKRAGDEEDVALSAFDSFCQGASKGRFPQLEDRNNLWRLLVVITIRKAIDFIHHENRRPNLSQSALGDKGLDEMLDQEPSPMLAAQVAEQCQHLLKHLGDDTLRKIAVWKMEGFKNREIAKKLGCVEGTIERKLRVIRNSWKSQISGLQT
jgi:DNA-directed RNA polymerase specialized sigma24 family protein